LEVETSWLRDGDTEVDVEAPEEREGGPHSAQNIIDRFRTEIAPRFGCKPEQIKITLEL
jgi:hypothetical protein